MRFDSGGGGSIFEMFVRRSSPQWRNSLLEIALQNEQKVFLSHGHCKRQVQLSMTATARLALQPATTGITICLQVMMPWSRVLVAHDLEAVTWARHQTHRRTPFAEKRRRRNVPARLSVLRWWVEFFCVPKVKKALLPKTRLS